MEIAWVEQNWFDLLQSIGIVVGLFFTTARLHRDTQARRTATLIEITKEHRAIWTELYRRPELARILQANVNLDHLPITTEENLFISLLILHLNSAYHAIRDGVYMKPEGLRKDIHLFFSRPIARAVWEKTRPLQDNDFVSFVESCFPNI